MLRSSLCILIILEYSVAVNINVPDKATLDLGTKDVVTNSGLVRGRLVNEGEGEYYAFLGIPYAAPMTYERRFKPPLPPIPWDGVFIANRTVECSQRGSGEEDCLIVNVFTPTTIVNSLAPVLVYIHGGSYIIGKGQTRGVGPLIKQNIIVVTINYRLGALGFLCLGIDEAPGNAGLKDQRAALLWVKKNIKNFGGDPAQVTLYGMSAGGASTELHVLSKTSEGLFHRAIVESASALSVWAVDADPIKTALNFAASLHLPERISERLYSLISYLQHVPSDQLSVANFDYYSNFTDMTFGFSPCVEKKFYGTKPFLSKPPLEILTKQDYSKVPIMFLFSALEGLFLKSEEYYTENYKNKLETNFLDFMPADLIFDTDEIKQEVAKNLKSFYFGNNTVGDNSVIKYLEFVGDIFILDALLNSAEMHAKGGNPVYLMEFAYKGNMGSYEKFYEDITVAGHGDIIKHAILLKPVRSQADRLAVDRVAKLIANYVKFGNPTPAPTELLPTLWPQVRPGNVSCLYMDKDFEVHEEPHWEQKVFWDSLYSQYRRPIKPVDPGYLWRAFF
ncbi:esterase FE4-like isoform X1 [Choristoneura fumiferana]|uniref:esterase FE4-like isoform X1 n=2 Tax=Choristoneura fumiferana TaxID=7141 RepID=UPI003D157B8C